MLTFFDLDGGRRDRILIEGDIPVLQQMPESVIFSLHQEMYLYLVRANPDLDAFLNLNVECFWNICHEAMSDHRFMAQQEVFLDGAASTVAYIVVSGCLAYNRYSRGPPRAAGRLSGASALTSERGITLESSAGSQPSSNPTPLQVSIVDTQAWLAEAALWMKWSHRGTLVASTAVNLVEMDCDVARRIVVALGGPLLSCMRLAACFFADGAGEDFDQVTDLARPAAGIAERALRVYRKQCVANNKWHHNSVEMPKGAVKTMLGAVLGLARPPSAVPSRMSALSAASYTETFCRSRPL